MIHDAAGWLNLFMGVLAVVSAIGAGLSIATVRELRARVQDLRGEIADKDRRLHQAETDVLHEQSERKMQAVEIRALQRLVTGDEKLNLIRIDLHDQEALLQRILLATEGKKT